MPTITYHRFWCTTCNDWTLFDKAFGAETDNCKVCGSVINESVLLKDIPREKILEQRKRYQDSETKSLFDSPFLNPRPYNPFSEDFPEPEIVEHDAGQKDIGKANRERRLAEWEKEKKIQAELKIKFAGLGRNDACGCGSGKKFKKCCQPKIQYL